VKLVSFGEAFFILLAERGVMPKEGLWMVYAPYISVLVKRKDIYKPVKAVLTISCTEYMTRIRVFSPNTRLVINLIDPGLPPA
jgi:hypothetical protein